MNLFSSSAMMVLLNKSLAGGTVILAILLLRFVMKRFPKKYLCMLWLIPFARLLFVIPMSSPFLLLPAGSEPLAEASITIGETGFTGTIPQLATGVEKLDSAVNEFLCQSMLPAVGDSADPMQSYAFVFQCVWLIGMGVFVVINLFRYIGLKRSLFDAVLIPESERMVKGKAIEGAYSSDRISMPMFLGIRQPKIYLPSYLLEKECQKEKEMILIHEHAHRLRRDYLTKLAVFGVLAIHWFNPLVWAAYLCYCKDVEMACDEKALEWLGGESRKDYSLALLHFQEQKSLLLIPLAFGESHTKSRIKNVLHYKKPGFLLGVLAVILVIGAGAAFLTNPEKKAEESISIMGGSDGPTSIFLAGKLDGEKSAESMSIIGGSDGPTSVFLAGKIDGESVENEEQAERLELEAARQQPIGMAVELDRVSANQISLHGSFGYLSFDLEGKGKSLTAKPKAAFTLSEADPLVMQGDNYTEVLGGEDSALVVTNAYNDEEDSQFFLYSETYGIVEQIEDEDTKKLFLENREQGAFRDAYLESEYLPELIEAMNQLDSNGTVNSSLKYGPVAILELDSDAFGFLAADGEKLEDLWYGIWYPTDGRIEKIPLF